MGFRADLQVADYIERTGWDPAAEEYEQFGEQREKQRHSSRLRGPDDLAEASTSTALQRFPTVIWDANGYYRAHGFTWPYRDVTIRALRLAHHERGGRDDAWMTYALTQLRNPARRRAYDSTALGAPYLDRYVREVLAAKLDAKSRDVERATGRPLDVEEVLRDLGFDLDDEPSTEDVSAGQDPSSTPPAGAPEEAARVSPPWLWSYYQLRSTCDDTERLSKWQEHLVEAFTRVGSRYRFAVGFVGRTPHNFMTAEIGNRLIFLLNDRAVPTIEMATTAVATLAAELGAA